MQRATRHCSIMRYLLFIINLTLFFKLLLDH